MIPFNGHKPMTNKKIKQGFWKNAVVFFNGHMAKVTDFNGVNKFKISIHKGCLLYTSPSPRDATLSRMPSSA